MAPVKKYRQKQFVSCDFDIVSTNLEFTFEIFLILQKIIKLLPSKNKYTIYVNDRQILIKYF